MGLFKKKTDELADIYILSRRVDRLESEVRELREKDAQRRKGGRPPKQKEPATAFEVHKPRRGRPTQKVPL